MISKDQWKWCQLCETAYVVCEACQNSSCNCGGCDECKELWEEVSRIKDLDEDPKIEDFPREDVTPFYLYKDDFTEEEQLWIDIFGGKDALIEKFESRFEDTLKKKNKFVQKLSVSTGEERKINAHKAAIFEMRLANFHIIKSKPEAAAINLASAGECFAVAEDVPNAINTLERAIALTKKKFYKIALANRIKYIRTSPKE